MLYSQFRNYQITSPLEFIYLISQFRPHQEHCAQPKHWWLSQQRIK